jgi:hypothetical protein
MSLELHSSPDWADDNTLRTLRELHAPPGGEAYWSQLEARIMERVAGSAPAEWWSAFDGWVRIGLAAAAIVAVLVGAAMSRSNEVQARLAYEAVMENASGVPVAGPAALRGTSATSREATLKYVMSY